LAAKGPSLPGPEPPHRQLRPAPGRQGPGGGRAAAGRVAEGAAVRVSPHGGLVGPGRGPGAAPVAPAGFEHSPPPAAPPPFRQRHPPAGRGSPECGLELRLRPRPDGRRTRLEDAVRDRRIHPGVPGDRSRGKPAGARRDPDLSRLMRIYGKPAFVRSDNGAEFTAAKVMRWLRDAAIGPAFIAPGSPWQNGFVE